MQNYKLLKGEDECYDALRAEAYEAGMELRKAQMEVFDVEILYWRDKLDAEEAGPKFDAVKTKRAECQREWARRQRLAAKRAETVLEDREKAKVSGGCNLEAT